MINIKFNYIQKLNYLSISKLTKVFCLLAKIDLFDKLNQSIAEYTAEKQLIILIDELDRTRPDYAINFLETLKHFFDVKGLIFILAVNKEQLKQSVECVYGKIDFDEYYRKFAHRDIALPYSEEGINSFIIKTVDDFFKKLEIQNKVIAINKSNIRDKGSTIKAYISEFFIKLKLSPRQINQFFRILLSLLISDKKCLSFGEEIASIIFVTIQLHDSEIAKKIAEGEFKYEDFLKFLDDKNIKSLGLQLMCDPSLVSSYKHLKEKSRSTKDHLELNLLFLLSKDHNELYSNRIIYENKFGKIEEDIFLFRNDLMINPHDNKSSIMQKIGKKVLQSKKLFDQF